MSTEQKQLHEVKQLKKTILYNNSNNNNHKNNNREKLLENFIQFSPYSEDNEILNENQKKRNEF